MGSKILAVCILVFVMISCGEKILDSQEYIQWIEDNENGLVVEKTYKATRFSLQYKPAGYLILKENRMLSLNKESYAKALNEVNKLYHFNLNISLTNNNGDVLKQETSNDKNYLTRLEYFSYEAQNDFKLVSGGDTLTCVLYHFERSYQLKPYHTIVIGFEKRESDNNKDSDLTVIFHDRALVSERIHLTIKAQNINTIPKLLINEKKDN